MRAGLRRELTGVAGVVEVRGMGLMIGVQLDRPCGELVKHALAAGLLINVTNDTVIRLLPPLILTAAEADRSSPDWRLRSAASSRRRHRLLSRWHSRSATSCSSAISRAKNSRGCSSAHVIRFKRYEFYQPLRRHAGDGVEKASRTRVSFEAGMYQMGGSVVNLTTTDSQLGRAEPVEDTARVISRMVDIVMIRTFEQTKLEAFAAHSRVPVINGLTNEYHPCQILADVFTCIEQRGPISGRTVAWIGDANNMAYAWIQAAHLLDFRVNVSTPPGYRLDPRLAPAGPHLKVCADPIEAAASADLVTTDVWTSMGFEAENEARRRAFANWQVNDELMRAAQGDALFMHCLPAHRGEEVTASVMDGPQSVVWDEAENRLHAQKALMEYLLLGRAVE